MMLDRMMTDGCGKLKDEDQQRVEWRHQAFEIAWRGRELEEESKDGIDLVYIADQRCSPKKRSGGRLKKWVDVRLS